MIEIKNKVECCGCSACYSICPQKAIKIVEDEEGFDYPMINYDLCIHCNLCDRVCPIKQESIKCQSKYTIAIQNKDEQIRKVSSAGGFVGALLNHWFEGNNIGYAVGYDEKNIPKFYRLTSIEECLKYRIFSSKYVTCKIGDIFSDIKKDLYEGKKVCFIGLPCQVAGLYSFLHQKYQNLFLVDLVCYGVPSRKLYRNYLKYLQEKYKNRIVDVRFRDKIFGYSAPTMCIEFEGGFIRSQNSDVKSFLRTFFSHLSIRPSCYNCHFKQIDRCSDLTIGDVKNIRQYYQSFDDNLGTTLVYIHSIEGENILNSLKKHMRICNVDINRVINIKNNKMTTSPKMNSKREAFFSEIDILSYNQLIDKYCPADKEEKITNVVKSVFLFLGLHKSKLFKILKETIGKHKKK